MKPLPYAAILAMLWLTATARAQATRPTLNIGDPAPPLRVGGWVKGEPVEAFQPGTVYVVEFWATWCGPCIDAIPHLSDLQDKYAKQGVVVIGQNVWEPTPSKVEPFVKKMGQRMRYRVALDDMTVGRGAIGEGWLRAIGFRGIPTSFIVDRAGRVAWIGHPRGGLEETLRQVVAGTWDLATAAEQDRKNREMSAVFDRAYKEKDWDALIRIGREQNLPALIMDATASKGDYAELRRFTLELLDKSPTERPAPVTPLWVAGLLANYADKDPAADRLFRELVDRAKASGEFDAASGSTQATLMLQLGQVDEALAFARQYFDRQRADTDSPDKAAGFAVSIFKTLAAKGHESAAYRWARSLVDDTSFVDGRVFNTFAWDIATSASFKHRDLDLALRAGRRAVQASEGKDEDALDTLARVQFDRGEIAAAIESQQAAVNAAPAEKRAEFEEVLERYRAAQGR